MPLAAPTPRVRMEGISDALARLKKPERAKAFPVPTRTFSAAERKRDSLKARNAALVRRFIRPENTRSIVENLPTKQGDRLHAVVCGDFVFCDLLLAIAATHPGVELMVSTLSLSRKNVDSIAAALDAGILGRFDLILSHYFQSTSRDLYEAVNKTLAQRSDCRVVTTRTHCKIALFHGAGMPPLTIEGSANLRSSGNSEQIAIFADSGLHDFHCETFAALLK